MQSTDHLERHIRSSGWDLLDPIGFPWNAE